MALVNKVFIDSCVFIALFNKRDGNHAAATSVLEKIRDVNTFFISDYILDEVITFLRNRSGKSQADKACYALAESDFLEMIIIDKMLLDKSIAMFLKCPIKKISFTDITTCAIMDELKIPIIFTFDKHFNELGYSSLN